MDFFFMILLITLLVIFGYAQLQRGVVRTPSQLTFGDHDDPASLDERL